MNTQLGIRLLSKTASAPRALFRQSSSIQVCIRPGSIIHRAYSNNSSTVDAATKPAVTVSKAKDSPTVAIVTLHQSAFSHETAKLFVKEWQAMEEDQTIRAAVLKSDLKSIFCAGIDFSEFMKGPESFAAYWRTIRKVFDTIYSSRLNTAASMHGHSLGLGCVLGMACQDRFMIRGAAPGVGSLFGSLGHDGAAAPPPPTSKPPTIGLNEVAVGVPVPEWLVELFGMITSVRHAERFLPLGRILSVQEAVSIGLVDKADFMTQEEMDAFVIRYLEGRNTVPREAQVETMRVIRRRFLEQFRAMEEADVANITRYVQAEEAQAVLRESMAKLASKARRA